ncbi:MAG: TonB-dependent receptor [Oscillatoria princeps RMCB-10]|jgi:hypothetical protein|nr:TonB-dependent receptor [Oscillatoria princeps RMCB-10]
MNNLRLVFLLTLIGAIASPKVARSQPTEQNTNFVLQLPEQSVMRLSESNVLQMYDLFSTVPSGAILEEYDSLTIAKIQIEKGSPAGALSLKALPENESSLGGDTGEPPAPAAGSQQDAQLFTRNRDEFGRLSVQSESLDKLSQIPSSPNPGTTTGASDSRLGKQAQPPGSDSQSQIPSSPNPGTPSQLQIANSIRIVTPAPGTVVDVPAVTVILEFPIGVQVELLVNGQPAEPKLVGRTETDSSTGKVTQTWYGVPLKEGENTLEVREVGNPVAVENLPPVTVTVRGAPAQLKVETVETRIPADGRSTATVRGFLLDAAGNRSNRDAVVTLAASAGKFTSPDYDLAQPGYQVKATAGEFTATLQSSLSAGAVRIRAAIANPNPQPPTFNPELEAFAQLQFQTDLRPSLVTGVVDFRLGPRGTDFWGSMRDFLPADGDNSYQLDVRGAAFATGALGGWLFTGAYNSFRNLNQTCDRIEGRRLFGDIQFSEQEYPVYGDSCSRETVAPSSDSVYLRFERSSPVAGADPDYFMWGDYSTAEFSTSSQQFTGITRSLHGFKHSYNIGDLQFSGFYSPDVEGFQRDTIVPDGTSGYYFLSRRLVISGSEDVFLEVEELDRPGTVLYRQQLSRGADYEIDYDRGTLLFRRPVQRVEIDPSGAVLVRRIVTTYQFDSQNGDTSIWGGRLQYHLTREGSAGGPSWFGATYMRENQGVRNFELYGGDFLLSFGSPANNAGKTSGVSGQLVGEYAHSSNDSDIAGAVSGSAYRLDLNARLGTAVSSRLYYRSTETGFSNNATTSFVAGQTRYGGQVSYQVSRETQVRASYDRERNQGVAPRVLTSYQDLFEPRLEQIPGSQVDNELTTISAGVLQRLGRDATVEFDYINRHREDNRPTNPFDVTSSQLRSRLTYRFTDTLTFRAQNELNLSSEQDIIYPNRTILGLDWAVYPGIAVRLSHIFFNGGQYEENSITSLDIVGDYKVGQDTTLTGRFGIVNAQAMTGALGIKQGWTIAPGLRLDGSYEHIFGDLFGRTGTGVQYAQPYAYGQGASALGVRGGDSYSVGLQYTGSDDFQASARYEHRTSSGGDNTVISAAANGKISRALTALFRYQQASSSNQLLEALGDTVNFRLGLAYRNPADDKFNALLRYDYRSNPSTIPDTIFLGSGTGYNDHTFALEAIYAPDWRWEFYGKVAMRRSTSYLADDLVGSGTVGLTQLRATYRLGYRWDVASEVRWVTQPADGYDETGFVIEAGYYLTPDLRLSAGYVFGDITDRDLNGSRNASGPYVGLTVKVNELFSGFGLQKPVAAPVGESRGGGSAGAGQFTVKHTSLNMQVGGEKKWR